MRTVLVILCLALAGCQSTVAPKPVTGQAASYDGNDRNSGVVGPTSGGFIVTDDLRARYNALIELYGERYSPPLRKDAGLCPSADGRYWIMDREHLTAFLVLNSWKKSLKPTAP